MRLNPPVDGFFRCTTRELLPFGGGDWVCLGKALAEQEIRLMAVGRLGQCRLQLAPDQDLSLVVIPSPSPKGGLLVQAGCTSCC